MKKPGNNWQRRGFAASAFIAIITLIVILPDRLVAQESIGEGVEVDRSRERTKEAFDKNLYNLKLGQIFFRFDAAVGVEFNDNPRLVENPKRGDFVFRPELNIGSAWPVNENNTLTLNLGIGYEKYIDNTDLDHVIIAPNSELSYDIRIHDVRVNFHDRIAHVQDPLRQPTVSGTGDFSGIENTVGTRVDWDLNKLQLALGYDHFNFISTSSGLSNIQDRASEFFYSRAGVALNPGLRTGLEAGAGLTDYEDDFLNDNQQYAVGPFVEAQITKFIKGRAAVGYVHYDFDSSGTAPPLAPINDYYFDISVEHEISQYMSHQLDFGRHTEAGTSTELATLWYVRYQHKWDVQRNVVLRSSLQYEWGREHGGLMDERLSQFGFGFALTVPLSRKLSATAGYQFVIKDSDLPNRDYLQNRVSIDLRYAF